ncbi:hypothetical protein ABIE13_002301 [Ottowia thiooxydans]|uniref:Uncharacterized protein n=1 Tax=Ottowia thiooxydans TaxID=219182 RepID=A0ABV2Q836_9BURK
MLAYMYVQRTHDARNDINTATKQRQNRGKETGQNFRNNRRNAYNLNLGSNPSLT